MRFIRKDGVIVKNLSKQERLPLVKKAYCEEGKTQKQIAEELMVVEATISKDLSYLREIGEIDQGLIEKRRNKVKELYNLEKSTEEIANIIGVSTMTILRDLKELRENGEISEIPISILRRWEKERTLYYEQGNSLAEIAKELQIEVSTVSADLRKMKEHGLITEEMKGRRTDFEIKKQGIEERRIQVNELYFNQGKSRKEIAEKFGVSEGTIRNDIQYLKEQKAKKRRIRVKMLYFKQKRTIAEIAEILGISSEMVREDIKYLKEHEIRERRENVRMLYHKEKQKEIAAQLGVSLSTIKSDIKYLKKQKKITIDKVEEQKQKRQKRRGKVEKLMYIQGKEKKEIAEKLGITLNIVKNDIRVIKEQRKEQPQKYIDDYRTRFKSNKIKPHEMESIKELIDLTKKYPDIIFYTRICVHFNEFEEALQFINRQIEIEEEKFTEEERRSLDELKTQIEKIYQRLSQRGIQESENLVELGSVIEMRKKLEEREEKSRKLEENDGSDELQIG